MTSGKFQGTDMNNLDWNRNGVAWKGLENPEDHKRRDGLAGRVEVGHRTE